MGQTDITFLNQLVPIYPCFSSEVWCTVLAIIILFCSPQVRCWRQSTSGWKSECTVCIFLVVCSSRADQQLVYVFVIAVVCLGIIALKALLLIFTASLLLLFGHRFCRFFFLFNLVLKMGLSGKLQLSLLWSLVVVVSVFVLCGQTVRAVDSSSSTSMVPELLLLSGKDQNGEMESSVMRRMLANSPFQISYGALSADRIPCPAGSGRSYYTHNCYAANGPVTPYTRGCSAITLCARG